MSKEKRLYFLVFLIIFIYLIIRAFTVFITHDEIVSKWSYMIDWNPFPYQGYIDANNQFLNSLLGGLFIRLFHSDHTFIIRLASLLCFPFYALGIFRFRKFFHKRSAFAFFFIALIANPFIIEFFALARGYSMAWMFLIWGIYQLFELIRQKKIHFFFGTLVFSILALFANLSLLVPVSLLIAYASLYMVLNLTKKQQIRALVGLVLWSIPFVYLVLYALDLQEIGKLYLGDSASLYATSLENLVELSFNLNGMKALLLISLMATIIGIQIVKQLIKRKAFFDLTYLFAQLLALNLVGVILLQLILDVNYPENRAAAYLYLLSMPAFAFALDKAKTTSINWGVSGLLFFVFISQYNITHTKTYEHEYINFELLEHIPDQLQGIPPACGGRQLAVSKVIYRESDQENMHFFQTALSEADTLQDYILCLEEDRQNIKAYYDLAAKTDDSRMLLYERKTFLNRTHTQSWTHEVSTSKDFVNLIPKQPSKPAFIHCKGYFTYSNMEQDASIVYAQSDSADNKYNYGSFTPLSAVKKSSDGKLHFDFTVTFLDLKEAEVMSFYIWNKKQLPLEGEISVSLYEITF